MNQLLAGQKQRYNQPSHSPISIKKRMNQLKLRMSHSDLNNRIQVVSLYKTLPIFQKIYQSIDFRRNI